MFGVSHLRSIFFIVLGCLSVVVTPADADEQETIRPGDVWLDTDGHPINAHGGGVLFHAGRYYWYGEIKEGETHFPDCNKEWGGSRVDVVGISCYSSTDLLNWRNEGNVLPAVSDDRTHDLHRDRVLERPKVIFNAKTNKFVMWLHIDTMDYSAARSGVAVSNSPTGPFNYVRSFRPNQGVWPLETTDKEKTYNKEVALPRDYYRGQMARDQALFVDDDGRAYHFYSSEDNATLHVSELSDDYQRPTGKYKRLFVDRFMEAPAVFKREGKYYLIASGCTAWAPNPARSAMADSIWGPWEELGNPCQGRGADKTFNSQSTYVLPISGQPGAFVFMADRWNPSDLKDSRYIWLPLQFGDQQQPLLQWRDEWRPADTHGGNAIAQ